MCYLEYYTSHYSCGHICTDMMRWVYCGSAGLTGKCDGQTAPHFRRHLLAKKCVKCMFKI